MSLAREHLETAWPKILKRAQRFLSLREREAMHAAVARGDAEAVTAPGIEAVIQVRINSETGDRELCIWWASGSAETFRQHLPEIQQLAQRVACKRLVFYTRRRGWLRRAADYGWELDQLRFVMDVDHEPRPSQPDTRAAGAADPSGV